MRIAALLLLLLPTVASAEPRHHWYKDPKNWMLIATSIAASAYATHEIHDCRMRNDLIHCPDGGYGEFRAREEIRLGGALGMAALSIYGREHWSGHWYDKYVNDTPVILYSGYNVRVGIADHRVPTYPKVDTTRFRVTR